MGNPNKKKQDSGRKYFNLINNILEVIVEFNLDYVITYINPQVYDVFGYSPKDILGKKAIDFIHHEDLSRALAAIKKGIATRETIVEELRILHKKGHYISVSTRGRLVEFENQLKIITIFRDLTIEKEVEEKLRNSDKRYREIIENIEYGYFEMDLKGKFVYVNDYICRYLGNTQSF
ncbi:MAG: PAS domain-containing protein [Promethearchaeota archaeon]|jgi:two-component system sporulation sensor kinase A